MAREAGDRLATLERSFSDVEAARARLKIIQRELADSTELQITPPASVTSAAEFLASALRKRKTTLDDLGVVDLAAARARNEIARDAVADLRTLAARIEAATPADDALQLAAGSAALKLFVAELGTEEIIEEGELPDIAALTKAMETADSAAARAERLRARAGSALPIGQLPPPRKSRRLVLLFSASPMKRKR